MNRSVILYLMSYGDSFNFFFQFVCNVLECFPNLYINNRRLSVCHESLSVELDVLGVPVLMPWLTRSPLKPLLVRWWDTSNRSEWIISSYLIFIASLFILDWTIFKKNFKSLYWMINIFICKKFVIIVFH